MAEQITSQFNLPDSEFIGVLDSIEGFDQDERRAGVARLERIGGNKAFQVARVLVGDADPVVAATSRRICSTLKKSGMPWHGVQRLARPAETKIITDKYQLLDEVAFIIRRNLGEIVNSAFLVSIPKLMFVFFMFVGPYLVKDMGVYVNIYSLGGLILLHQLMWRPLAWIAIGKAVLGGFADRASRQLAKKRITCKEYLRMFLSNSVLALPFTYVLTHGIHSWINHHSGGIDFFLWTGFWIIFWELTFFANSAVLLLNQAHPVLEAVALRFKKGPPVLGSNFFFLVVTACLYGSFFLSSIASNVFLGVSLQTWGLGIPQSLWLFTFWVIADCFLDPFIIGYKLLFARLYINRSEE